MSKKFKKVKEYFDKGYWSVRQVYDAVGKGWITPEEYKIITGYDYDDGE
jgi:uncharacterized XkdX family phage protein